MKKKGYGSKGFTLIELLIVFFILTAMIMIPVKLLTRGDTQTMFRHQVRELVGELNRIRAVAATTNSSHRLAIDWEDNHYVIEAEMFDTVENAWVRAPQYVPFLKLSQGVIQNIEEDGAVNDFPIFFAFNSRGLQLNDDNMPVLAIRTVEISNVKSSYHSEDTLAMSLSINPLGGLRVKDKHTIVTK